MLRSFFTLLAFLTILSAHKALAYNIEDYAITERATFDALLKASSAEKPAALRFLNSVLPVTCALVGPEGKNVSLAPSINLPD